MESRYFRSMKIENFSDLKFHVKNWIGIRTLGFVCNICGTNNRMPVDEISREAGNCKNCQSTVRMRQIGHIFSKEVLNTKVPFYRLPKNKNLTGIGMSDWLGYAQVLSEKFNYKNTFYHQDPQLDITSVPESMKGTCDFVISSDVFEHVLAPVQRAFDGAHELLRPGGILILTLPFNLSSETIEHFQDLTTFEIKQDEQGYYMINKMKNGETQIRRDLIFHGGPGQTLEMRVFGEKAIISHLEKAGFTDIKIWSKPYYRFGICIPLPWSLPITARAK